MFNFSFVAPLTDVCEENFGSLLDSTYLEGFIIIFPNIG